MEKYLTEKLIEDRLRKRGVGESYQDIDEDLANEQLKNHFGFEITEDWKPTADHYIYEESTADGYTVYISTDNPDRIDIGSDIFYYENDLDDKFYEVLGDGLFVYTDDTNSYQLREALERLYDDYIGDIKKEIEDELIEEGYERTTEMV